MVIRAHGRFKTLRIEADTVVVLIIQCKTTSATETDRVFNKEDAADKFKNKVNLAVYIEAQCGDTSRFVHRQLLPTWEKLSVTNRISLKIVPFGKATCQPTGDDYRYPICLLVITKSRRMRHHVALHVGHSS
ncbi:unnamed protein product [Gongylonema pulchrum]|uniref:C2 domain-containing protein n=1 Tax=Gongylonema pulchrum TaxID=637853 RepID=A0A183EWK8_9BILA|nr:unnamed protein product [Gongylonema pulchrum]